MKTRAGALFLLPGMLAMLLIAAMLLVAPGRAGVPVYIALGDSIAFGEGDAWTACYGDQGYVKLFADYLGAAYYSGQRPRVVNLGVPGETSTSIFSGVAPPGWDRDAACNLNYTDPNQPQLALLQQTLAAEKTAGNRVDFVTFALGANDMFYLRERPEFNAPDADRPALLNETLDTIRAGYDAVLAALRSEAPDAQILLLNYYNPFAIFCPDIYMGCIPEEPFAGQGAIAREAAARYNGTFVDIRAPFVGHELEYTYIGSMNIHPTPAGYAVISEQLIRAACNPGAFTLADVLRCLEIACGFRDSSPEDLARLNMEADNAFLDVNDAFRLARKVAGLEANP